MIPCLCSHDPHPGKCEHRSCGCRVYRKPLADARPLWPVRPDSHPRWRRYPLGSSSSRAVGIWPRGDNR